MIMIMTDKKITVQHKQPMLKTMEDGGTMIVGALISTSNTILHSLAPYTLLALGTIPGGSR